MRNTFYYAFLGLVMLVSAACNKEGCTDSKALNYDPEVTKDDGSCVYLVQNLNFRFNAKLGTTDFAYNKELTTTSGRKVKVTKAQMYLSGFSFNGNGTNYTIADSYLLMTPEVSDYNVGYLPEATYDGFSFTAGVDSVANHTDPATWPGTSALSSNNPNHMHWGWNPGYIFFVLEGKVDTSAAKNGAVNAPFVFHVGTDMHRVKLPFAKQVQAKADGVTVELAVDWFELIKEMDMTEDLDSRITHVDDNPALAALFVSKLPSVFTVH
ncbi:MbnP family protein [Bacteroidota bacterium]